MRLPCKTPLLTFIFILFSDIFNLAFEYNSLIVPIISSFIPCSDNLQNNLLCITLSYEFLSSINIKYFV